MTPDFGAGMLQAVERAPLAPHNFTVQASGLTAHLSPPLQHPAARPSVEPHSGGTPDRHHTAAPVLGVAEPITTRPPEPHMQATPGAQCPDPLAVEQTQILCPCVPEEFPPRGACPRGLQCAAATQNPLWDPSGGPLWVEGAGFICQPCVYGQYCPRGSFQPVYGAALLQYVERYSCRCVC